MWSDQSSSLSMASVMDVDATLWKDSCHINPMETLPSPWLFNLEQSTLLILCSPNPTRIQLPKLALVFCALLDIHTSYWGTDSPDVLEIQEHTKLAIYHNKLKRHIEAKLLLQNELLDKDDVIEMPEVMGPWIQRTVTLFSHDDDGHKEFAKHKFNFSLKKPEGMIHYYKFE